jgi:formylglycine-generating enzyme required for sulfatase activity
VPCQQKTLKNYSNDGVHDRACTHADVYVLFAREAIAMKSCLLIAALLAVTATGCGTTAVITRALSTSAAPGPRVPPGFAAKPGTAAEPYSATGWAARIIHEPTGMELAFIPAGNFLMGTPAGEAGRRADETQHEVTISRPFYMGVTQVTRGQFAAFVSDSGYKTEAETTGWCMAWDGTKWGRVDGITWRKPGFEQTDKHPVVCMTWNDATAFCQWLSRKSGAAARLPTEAQFEYAARAGTRTAYVWGDDPDGGKGWCNVADQSTKRQFPTWAAFKWDDGYAFTAPVGSFKPNAWGLFDTTGNTWEWCTDWYGRYADGPATDPTGPATGTDRVMRGASWGDGPVPCRSGYRRQHVPDVRGTAEGLRVVVEVK